MEGDIHCLLGWVGALARPAPAIFRNYRSVNPGITMTALDPNPDLPRCPLLRRYWGTSGHQTRRLIRASRFMSTGPSRAHTEKRRALHSFLHQLRTACRGNVRSTELGRHLCRLLSAAARAQWRGVT